MINVFSNIPLFTCQKNIEAHLVLIKQVVSQAAHLPLTTRKQKCQLSRQQTIKELFLIHLVFDRISLKTDPADLNFNYHTEEALPLNLSSGWTTLKTHSNENVVFVVFFS